MPAALMAFALMVQPVSATDAFLARMTASREAVTKLAFDTERYFPEERYGYNDVRILYRGDDFSWPIYAIGVRLGCDERSERRGCADAFRVRMVRLPKTPDMRRPRDRAMPMWRRFEDGSAQTPQQVAAIVQDFRLEWLQTDSFACPAAAAVMARSGNLSWVSPKLYSRESRAKPDAIVMHADIIDVGFGGGPGNANYIGRDAPGTHAEWATRFAAALEPCWRPAGSVPPWRRPAP